MKKEDILAKTSSLVTRYGLKSVSMDDIAHELSMSKKTLYKYFPSKEDLLFEVVESSVESLLKRSSELAKQNKHPLIRCVLIANEIFNEFSDYNPTYHFTVNRFSVKISDLIDDCRHIFTDDFFTPLLEEAKNLDCFHQKADIKLFVEMYLRYVDRNYFGLRPILSSLPKEEMLLHLIVFPILGICKEPCRSDFLRDVSMALEVDV